MAALSVLVEMILANVTFLKNGSYWFLCVLDTCLSFR